MFIIRKTDTTRPLALNDEFTTTPQICLGSLQAQLTAQTPDADTAVLSTCQPEVTNHDNPLLAVLTGHPTKDTTELVISGSLAGAGITATAGILITGPGLSYECHPDAIVDDTHLTMSTKCANHDYPEAGIPVMFWRTGNSNTSLWQTVAALETATTLDKSPDITGSLVPGYGQTQTVMAQNIAAPLIQYKWIRWRVKAGAAFATSLTLVTRVLSNLRQEGVTDASGL